MWDALLTVGNAVFIPALVPTIRDRRAYLPRSTSGLAIIGLGLVIAGLFGEGLVLSPIIACVSWVMWLFIFIFRADPEAE